MNTNILQHHHHNRHIKTSFSLLCKYQDGFFQSPTSLHYNASNNQLFTAVLPTTCDLYRVVYFLSQKIVRCFLAKTNLYTRPNKKRIICASKLLAVKVAIDTNVNVDVSYGCCCDI